MINVILNPVSGGGKVMKAFAKVRAKLEAVKAEFRIFETEREKQAIYLSHELTSEGLCDILVVGGDGTLNEVVNGFTNFENCRLGLIPAGTGNDFASCVKIPADPLQALDLVLHGEAKYTDYMQMEGGVRGINIIGTGIDVEILQRCRRSKILRGKLQYVFSLIISLFKFKNYKVRAVYNGEEHNYHTLIACVGNGTTLGGGIRMCPSAVVDDGLLDFVAVDNVKRSRIPGAFIKLMKGKILEQSFTRFERCERAEVYPENRYTMNVDGELYEDLPFKVEIVKNKLRMFRP